MPGGRLARIRGGGGGGHDKFRTVRGGIMRKFNLVPRALFPGFGVGPLGLGWRKLAYKSRGLYDFTFLLYFQRNAFIAFGSIK